MTGAGVLVAVAGILVIGAAIMVWALCAASGRWDQAAERAHDAEVLRQLAAERLRGTLQDRLRQRGWGEASDE